LEILANGLVRHAEPAPFPFGHASVAEILDVGVRDHPNRLALIDGDRSWTYAELDQVVAVASSEAADPGQSFLLDEENSAELIIGVLAGLRVGGIWIASRTAPNLEAFHSLHFEAGADIDANAPAVVAFTSGSTGEPKAVVHSQHSMLLPAAVSLAVEPPADNERIGSPLDLRIVNVMILGPLSAFVRGSTFVVMRKRFAQGIAQDVAAYGITRLFAVPTLAHDLAHDEAVEPTQLRTLDRVILGGSGARPEMQKRFVERFGIRPTLSYGLSEAPTGVVRESLDDPIGSRRGHRLPHVELVVLDPKTGEEAPTGEVGEVCLRPATNGPWANTWTGTLGYLDRPALTEALFQNGLLHTGDLGSVDADGAVSIAARLSDLIIRGGANIDPRSLERALVALPSIAGAAVIGIDDDRLGQMVGAVLVPDEQALTGDIASELESAQITIDRWVVDVTLPRNAMGKLDREALIQLLLQ